MHTTKSSLHRLKPGFGRDKRPKTGNAAEKIVKKASGLDISRPKLEAETNSVSAPPAIRRDSLEEDMVELPALPSTFSPESRHILDEAAIENARPGTAITADEPVSTKTFELPADELWTSSDKPLPSPASLPFMERSHEPFGDAITSRKRSNSTASGKPRQKRASWFQVGKRKAAETDLPPPLPPPKDPPPKASAIQLLTAEYSNKVKGTSDRPVLLRNTSSTSSVARASIAKTSLDGESLLEAFPLVPDDVTPTPVTTEVNLVNSEDGRDSPIIPLPPRSPLRDISRRSSAADTKKPRNLAPMQTIDGVLSTTNGGEVVQKHDSKQSPVTNVAANNHTSMSFGEDLQREYDRTMKLLDLMDHKRSSGFIQVVRKSTSDPGRMTLEQKFSNEEALAALEFGLPSE